MHFLIAFVSLCRAMVSDWWTWKIVLDRLCWHIGMKNEMNSQNSAINEWIPFFFDTFNLKAGGALASLLSGMLIHYTGRWDVVFYFLAAILVVWWILFVSKWIFDQNLWMKTLHLNALKATICFEQPRNHPFIGNKEREYLQRKMEDYENERKHLPILPWKEMIKCPPVWALAFSTVRICKSRNNYRLEVSQLSTCLWQGLYSWSFYIISNDLPKYLNDVLHVTIEENSIYTSVPKVLSVIISIGSGFVCDLLLKKCHYDRTCIRKVFVVLSE